MVQPRRRQLQDLLEEIIESEERVYFQPPPTVKMQYPAIVFNLDRMDILHASNRPYKHAKRYLVTVIDRDPDSEIPDKIAMLPTASFSRSYRADGLNHTAFTLYF